ncbi:MAG: hypothetical protein QF785_05360 [Phycisphaeraceae bacterium]|jgi:hypothetical protein|nr:hypothetical protein [Phycisphaeraceae bacterium]
MVAAHFHPFRAHLVALPAPRHAARTPGKTLNFYNLSIKMDKSVALWVRVVKVCFVPQRDAAVERFVATLLAGGYGWQRRLG